MKLINKLLPMVAMGGIASCVVPSITSCGCHNDSEYSYTWEKKSKTAEPEQYKKRYGEGKQIIFSTMLDDYINAAGNDVLEWLAVDIASTVNKFSLTNSTATLNMKISKFDANERRISVSYDLIGKGPTGTKFEANLQWENVPFDLCPMGGDYGIMLSPAGFAHGIATYIFQFNDWSIHYYTKDGLADAYEVEISSQSTREEIGKWTEIFDGVSAYLLFGSLSYFDGAKI